MIAVRIASFFSRASLEELRTHVFGDYSGALKLVERTDVLQVRATIRVDVEAKADVLEWRRQLSFTLNAHVLHLRH